MNGPNEMNFCDKIDVKKKSAVLIAVQTMSQSMGPVEAPVHTNKTKKPGVDTIPR